jgi:hypothetical protein
MIPGSYPLCEPVISIVPVDEDFRALHHLSPDAALAVVESYEGSQHVCCTDADCPFGVEAAARAWAEATGAAYGGMAAA